jgi:aryl-alcohol dehydrogenase-like predicted oxidoreductase
MGTWKTFDVYGRDEQAARRELVTQALRQSVRLFDSSPMYGEAERVLGAALVGRRERAVVASKVWSQDLVEGHAQIDRALHYFDGRVDIYQVHNLVRWRDWLPVFERMLADGSVRAVGVTHYQQEALAELEEVIRTQQIHTIQIPYNPFERAAETRILPLAAERQLGVIVMRPFGEGTLLRRQPPPAAVEPFARFGCTTWPQMMLKWVLSDPRVSVVIPATRSGDHLVANAAAGRPPWFGPAEREQVSRLAEQYCR